MNSNLVSPIVERIEVGVSKDEIIREVIRLEYSLEEFDAAYSKEGSKNGR